MPDPTTPEAPLAYEPEDVVALALEHAELMRQVGFAARFQDNSAVREKAQAAWEKLEAAILSLRVVSFCCGGQPVMVYTPPGGLSWEDENV